MYQNQGGLALNRALSRLSPDAFNHPIWVNFIFNHSPVSESLIRDLNNQVQHLTAAGDMINAGQVLLISAFLQIRLGDFQAALQSLTSAQVLAENYSLPELAQWSAWGMSALLAITGHFEQAVEHLKWLEQKLQDNRDWVLANLVSLIKQGVSNLPQANGYPFDVTDWLLHWGEPIQAFNPAVPHSSDRNDAVQPLQPPGSLQRSLRTRWSSLFQKLSKIASGQLRLKWVETTQKTRPHLVSEPPAASGESLSLAGPVNLREPANNRSNSIEPSNQNSISLPLDRASEPEVSNPDTCHTHSMGERTVQNSDGTIPISIYCLGVFRLFYGDRLINNWSSRKGLSVFKYLVVHHPTPVLKEVLMDTFWREAAPDSARNRLNVAVHGVRQTLRKMTAAPVIEFEENAYRISSKVSLWTDFSLFDHYLQSAQKYEQEENEVDLVKALEAAVSLYQGDFLVDEPYEDWPIFLRERFRVSFLDALDRLSRIYFVQRQTMACISLCQQILIRDNCREDAHRRLMQCYHRQGQLYLAIRQYQTCLDCLRTELDLAPEPATTQLYERLRRHDAPF